MASWRATLARLFTPQPTPAPSDRRRPKRLVVGRRFALAETIDTMQATANWIAAPPDAETAWRDGDLDRTPLDRMPPSRLLTLLADISPEVSRALWDFLRFCNPGWTATAYKPGTETISKPAQQALDAFLKQLGDQHGATDVVINRLFSGAWLRGAFLAELVLNSAGKMPLDLATPDPATVRFRAVKDPERGVVWQLGQYQSHAVFVPLDVPTVRYVPVDPFPSSPYGRSPAHPALFAAMFLLNMLHDIKRVVSQQGYPRLDLIVDTTKLVATMPEDMQNDPEAVEEWVRSAIDDIAEAYTNLEPDDAYVHTDAIEINSPVGATTAGNLAGIATLIEGLERMVTRALKTMPLLMGNTEGVSETNAARQWEIHVAGIKSLQHLCEGLLEYLLGLALQAQGIQATVQFRFAELRYAELMRDEQVQSLKLRNAQAAYDAGYMSQDEASEYAVGHKADSQTPRAPSGKSSANPLVAANPEPGAAQ